MNYRALLIILLLPFGGLKAQESCSGVLIDFETDNEFILYDTLSDLWQVGSPDKQLFNQSFSGHKAIMTNLNNTYDNNLSTYFQIISLGSGTNTTLSFWHKWDTDPNDKGYLDYSLDGGESWNICKDTSFVYDSIIWGFEARIEHQRRYLINATTERYESDPSIYFSGTSASATNNWVHEFYWFTWAEFSKKSLTDEFSPDSIMFRFNFISDSIDNENEGWMIDDIQVEWDFIGNTDSYHEQFIKIYPNPFKDFLKIGNRDFNRVEIIDLTGRIIKNQTLKVYNQCEINTINIEDGIYIVRLYKNGSVYSRLIVKE